MMSRKLSAKACLRPGLTAILAALMLISTGCGRAVEPPASTTAKATTQTTTAPTEPEQDALAPFLLQATAPNGQTAFLFGTIHMADASIYPLPDYVMTAFEGCDCLAVEFDFTEPPSDYEHLQAIILQQYYQDGRTIEDDIGAELYDRLLVAVEATYRRFNYMRFPIESMENVNPFLWYQTLSSIITPLMYQKAGVTQGYGVDTHLIKAAAERGMAVIELESLEDNYI